jgi:hypothetical protein
VERQAAEKQGKFSSRAAASGGPRRTRIFTLANAKSARSGLPRGKRSAFTHKTLNQRRFTRATRTFD